MNDQYQLTDRGELVIVPKTWDGEPLYAPETVREGLFDPDAFHQFRGQLSIDQAPETEQP